MISVVEFPFVDGKSGKITFTPPSSYMAATGWAACQTGKHTLDGSNWRAFFNFDTSSIPDHAQVTKVEFLNRMGLIQIGGGPDLYLLQFSIGSFIGAALDGTADEFYAGTLMVSLYAKPEDNTWLDLNQHGHGPQAYVNLTGDTDIKVWDDSSQGAGDPYWSTDFNTGRHNCRLRVTYQVPSASATGRGTAVAEATVVFPGMAVATGKGAALASAVVAAQGSVAAVGRGVAEVIASVAVIGAGLATGRGLVVALVSVEAAGVASALGRGFAGIVPTIIADGIAGVAGRGFAAGAAIVTSVASGTATGRGAVFCDATAESLSAAAVATGHGMASCSLVAVYLEPVARHFAIRAARPKHGAVRSVSRAHERACVAERMN